MLILDYDSLFQAVIRQIIALEAPCLLVGLDSFFCEGRLFNQSNWYHCRFL